MSMKSRQLLSLAPVSEPLTLDEVKLFLRIDELTTEEDDQLSLLIKAARIKIEKHLNVKLLEQTWDIYFDGFGLQRARNYDDIMEYYEAPRSLLFNVVDYLELPFGNLQSVTSFETFDEDSNDFLFSDYDVDNIGNPPRVALKRNAVWPQTVLRSVNGIKIVAVFGYASVSDIPDNIKQAMLIYIAKLYENRGDDSTEEAKLAIPNAALALLVQDYVYQL